MKTWRIQKGGRKSKSGRKNLWLKRNSANVEEEGKKATAAKQRRNSQRKLASIHYSSCAITEENRKKCL
jgi:hypothetical protein